MKASQSKVYGFSSDAFELSNTFATMVKAACTMLLLLAVSKPTPVCGQTYYFDNVPTSGFREVSFSDMSHSRLNGGYLYGAGSSLGFGAMNGTLIYDPTNATMRMVGTVQVTGATGSLQFDDTFPPSGPNPSGLSPVPATITINYAVGNVANGWLSFDTGAFAFPAGTSGVQAGIPFDVTGSYSFDTGGRTYIGHFAEHTFMGVPVLFEQLPTGNSITVGSGSDTGGILSDTLAMVTADNGVTLQLSDRGYQDGMTYCNWQSQGFTAVVPEPSLSAILVCGLGGIGLLRQCRRRG